MPVCEMTARVDPERCTGCGLCADSAPEVFELDDSRSTVKTDPVPPHLEEAVREVADTCPEDAITVA